MKTHNTSVISINTESLQEKKAAQVLAVPTSGRRTRRNPSQLHAHYTHKHAKSLNGLAQGLPQPETAA